MDRIDGSPRSLPCVSAPTDRATEALQSLRTRSIDSLHNEIDTGVLVKKKKSQSQLMDASEDDGVRESSRATGLCLLLAQNPFICNRTANHVVAHKWPIYPSTQVDKIHLTCTGKCGNIFLILCLFSTEDLQSYNYKSDKVVILPRWSASNRVD